MLEIVRFHANNMNPVFYGRLDWPCRLVARRDDADLMAFSYKMRAQVMNHLSCGLGAGEVIVNKDQDAQTVVLRGIGGAINTGSGLNPFAMRNPEEYGIPWPRHWT